MFLLLLVALIANPILPYDYSDPDVIRVDKTYYMVSSSFQFTPGLPILTSPDMVHWTCTSAALPYAVPDCGTVWAPAIRYHKDRFYIYYGDPDHGIYCIRSRASHLSPLTWENPILICPAKGYIDPCPIWTKDGHCYLFHAFAGSRAGFKSAIAVMELSLDGLSVIQPSTIVFDGHDTQPTIEGPKAYYRNGYYYLFCPAGGVAAGWQLCLRSRTIYGPYEVQRVLEQGNTSVNGPHQGAWVDNYFIHFQDVGPAGRILHLQPLSWVNDWPEIGNNGTPVDSIAITSSSIPQFTDSPIPRFANPPHWSGNYDPRYAFFNAADSTLRLYSFPSESIQKAPNLRLLRIPAHAFTYTAKVRFCPNPNKSFSLFAYDKAQSTSDTLYEEAGMVVYGREIVTLPAVPNQWLWLRLEVNEHFEGQFYISADNIHYATYGQPFHLQSSGWSGARVGLYCRRNRVRINDSGWLEVQSEVIK